MNDQDLDGNDLAWTLALCAIAVVGVVLVGVVINWAFANLEAAAKKGPAGDFVGGFLNPVLTFLTFLGLLVSIMFQRRELRLSRVRTH